MPVLVVANKMYSSWSLRPWLLMRQLGLPFDEVLVPLRQPDTRERILRYSPAAKVPCLVDDDGTQVWESLAIVEYLAERFPDRGIWPSDRAARALARSISAEMHAGFGALRSACPMNLGRSFAGRDRGERVAADVVRIQAIWADARDRFGTGGPFLFGGFSGADAMYSAVVTRLDTYGVAVTPESRAYMDAVLSLPAFLAWRDAGRAEEWIVPDDEVDETPVAVFRLDGR